MSSASRFDPPPDIVQAFYGWLVEEAADRAERAGLPTPPIVQFAKRHVEVEPGVTYFASGAKNPGEIYAFLDIGLAPGVAAPNCLETDCEDALHALAAEDPDVLVFADSGAFSEVKFPEDGPPVIKTPISDEQWLRRFAFYDRLAQSFGPRLYAVAPDRVGDQDVTIERMIRYAPQVRRLQDQGVHILAPIQKGRASMADFYREVVDVLGPDIDVAIPMKKDATTYEEYEEFLSEVGPELRGGIHLLGLGPGGRVPREGGGGTSSAVIALTRELAPQARVTQDANLIRRAVGWGPKPLKIEPRMMTLANALAEEEMNNIMWGTGSDSLRVWSGKEGWQRPPDYTDWIGSPSAWLTDAQLKTLATLVRRVATPVLAPPSDPGLDKETAALDRERVARRLSLQARRDFLEDPEEFLSSPIYPEEPESVFWYELPEIHEALNELWENFFEVYLVTARKRAAIGYVFGSGGTPAQAGLSVEWPRAVVVGDEIEFDVAA